MNMTVLLKGHTIANMFTNAYAKDMRRVRFKHNSGIGISSVQVNTTPGVNIGSGSGLMPFGRK